LQATRPHLTRAALHHGLRRQGIQRLPDREGDQPAQKPFTPDPLGDVQIDSAAVRTEEGKLSLCVASDRTGQLADAERHEEANNRVAAQFLRHVVAAVPDKIPTVRTDRGLLFTNRQREP
jgi:hypothetical protein